MSNLIEYPSIKQFKEICSSIYRHSKTLNTQLVPEFEGYVKLHGTNFSAVYNPLTHTIRYQSRNRKLDYLSNFFNFQTLVYGDNGIEKTLLKYFRKYYEFISKDNDFVKIELEEIVLFGELIGQEIQKGVALEHLNKKFVSFDVGLILNKNLELSPNGDLVYFMDNEKNDKLDCILRYKIKNVTVNVWDKEELLKTQNELANLTDLVEKECPFAKNYEISGIGEGIVWRNDQYNWKFKVKGDEHANSKVRTLKPISETRIKDISNIDNFCSQICTDARFKQGIQYLRENDISEDNSKKTFLTWVVEDTLKEEIEDILQFIIDNSLNINNIKSQLYKNAVQYWDFKRAIDEHY